MSFEIHEFTALSTDKIHTLTGRVYRPIGEIKGYFQVVHGMAEHIARYDSFMSKMADAGWLCFGYDHLGHGKTATDDTELGFIASKGGASLLISDVNAFYEAVAKHYSKTDDQPYVLMGHSMGSFLSRLYVEKYPNSVSGHIIHGTGGPLGAAVPMGIGLVDLIMFFRGTKHRSELVKSIAFAGYNSHFPKSEGRNAWLTRDIAAVSDRSENPYTNFTFTVSAYKELFAMVGKSNSKSWFASYPKQLKTLILSGDEDPVGQYGNGVRYVYKQLLLAGAEDVSMKIYEGARHELFNETNKDEVFSDMENWLDRIFK